MEQAARQDEKGASATKTCLKRMKPGVLDGNEDFCIVMKSREFLQNEAAMRLLTLLSSLFACLLAPAGLMGPSGQLLAQSDAPAAADEKPLHRFLEADEKDGRNPGVSLA